VFTSPTYRATYTKVVRLGFPNGSGTVPEPFPGDLGAQQLVCFVARLHPLRVRRPRLIVSVGSTKGDGLLAVFGHPITHEDDVNRAVQAGLEITRDVSRLSDQSKRRFGFGVNVRVEVHWGLVYLDSARRDFSGSAANVATWISGLAPPGAVVVSDAVESLIRNDFELEARAPVAVNGVTQPIIHYRVVSERAPVA
jgi:class 3 adenylate cyclase